MSASPTCSISNALRAPPPQPPPRSCWLRVAPVLPQGRPAIRLRSSWSSPATTQANRPAALHQPAHGPGPPQGHLRQRQAHPERRSHAAQADSRRARHGRGAGRFLVDRCWGSAWLPAAEPCRRDRARGTGAACSASRSRARPRRPRPGSPPSARVRKYIPSAPAAPAGSYPSNQERNSRRGPCWRAIVLVLSSLPCFGALNTHVIAVDQQLHLESNQLRWD
jgi:hypothetical protein